MTSFSLLDEPWLPVRLRDEKTISLGLIEVFNRASEISALAETSPTSLVAEYRLLLAILHRALTYGFPEGWKDKDKVKWYNEGLPIEVIVNYLEQWRDRFWLFHPERPFMQVAALKDFTVEKEKKGKGKEAVPVTIKPWIKIALGCSSGNTPVLFDHSYEEAVCPISPEAALSYLLGYLQFVPEGIVAKFFRKAGDQSGPLADSAAFIAEGTTLVQTLLLNLHQSGRVNDLPAWEREEPTQKELSGLPTLATGPNDRYTRQTRAVLFRGSETNYVRDLYLSEGFALDEDLNAPDPMLSFRKKGEKDKASLKRVKFSEGKALWRDLPVLSSKSIGKEGVCAAVLNSALSVHIENSGNYNVYQPVLVAGLASNQATLERWRIERLRIPLSIIEDYDKHETLSQLIKTSEGLYSDLKKMAKGVLPIAIPSSFITSYFSLLERRLPKLMFFLNLGNFDQGEVLWKTTMSGAARHAWEQLKLSLGFSSRALQAVAQAEPKFGKLLAKHCPKSKISE